MKVYLNIYGKSHFDRIFDWCNSTLTNKMAHGPITGIYLRNKPTLWVFEFEIESDAALFILRWK